ncbi:MAG: hypothetical protein ABSG69_08990 [Candidatus Acidiferrum sp.]|jgi:hypothetical protein
MPDPSNLAASLSSPAEASLTNTYIQPNLNHALRVWWAFFWPTNLVSFILAVLLQIVAMHLYENTAIPAKFVLYTLEAGPYVITYTVAIPVMHYILGKTFRRFQIALVSTDPSSRQPLPVTYSRSIRVWWTYSWRTLALSLLGLAFVIYPFGWFVGLFEPQPATVKTIFFLLGQLVNCAFSLFILYSNVLDEDFSDFRVTLLPRVRPDPLATSFPV